jgi:hypothetical protein
MEHLSFECFSGKPPAAKLGLALLGCQGKTALHAIIGRWLKARSRVAKVSL